jgi:hypothetical protein
LLARRTGHARYFTAGESLIQRHSRKLVALIYARRARFRNRECGCVLWNPVRNACCLRARNC